MRIPKGYAGKLPIGPFSDKTDGTTPETGITLGAADVARAIKYSPTSATDISGYTWVGVTGAPGWYFLTCDASLTNTEGFLKIIVQDDDVCRPVVCNFEVVHAKAFNSLVDDTDQLEVDVVQWRGSQPAVLADTDKIPASIQHDADSTLLAAIRTRLGIKPTDAAVFVTQGTTDTERGDNLATALTAAKALTPSASNPVTVWAPDGRYKRTATLDWDTAYIHLKAITPKPWGRRRVTDNDKSDGTTLLSECRSTSVEIYSETADVTTFEQSADNVHFDGISFSQVSGSASGTYHAFYCSVASNAGSRYDNCYAWHRAPLKENTKGSARRYPWAFIQDCDGVWESCGGNAYGWRFGWDAGDAGQFKARMNDMEGGRGAFIGDFATGSEGTHKATGCDVRNSKCIGQWNGSGNGDHGFSGCTNFGAQIDATCYFESIYAGHNSLGVGALNAAKLRNCHVGNYGCGGTAVTGYKGYFVGEADDSTAGIGGFGGRAPGVSDANSGSLKGRISFCVSSGAGQSWLCEGAVIDRCLLEQKTLDRHCVTLLDSLSKITNSTLLVVEGGLGVPIYAATPQSVCAAGNVYNNHDVTADGLSSLVTNAACGSPTDNLTVLPYTSSIAGDGSLLARPLTVWQKAKGVWTIALFDAEGEPVNLFGHDLAFVAWLESNPATAVIELKNYNTKTDLTIGGGDNNQVTITCPDTDTATARVLQWLLRDMTDDASLARGKLTIHAAADAPAVA